MTVYVNGRFVPEDQATVSVFDRGFLYGDGIFETVRICGGKPFRWTDHYRRLLAGAGALRMQIPCREPELLHILRQLLELNGLQDCLLRIACSRGRGQRGYSPKGAHSPTLVLSLHALPVNANQLQSWKLATSKLRAGDPAGFVKSSSKLVQVLARMEAEAMGADEALLLDIHGQVTETTSGNVFWILKDTVWTVPLTGCVLPGITRAVILELCARQGIQTGEGQATPETLQRAEGVFLTLTTFGVVEIESLDDHALSRSKLTPTLHRFLISELAAQ